MNAKLTLELGLRYNIIEPLYSALGNFSTFDPARFDPARAPRVSPGDGSLVPGTGDPTNGIVIFGPSFPDAAHGRIPAADSAAAQSLFAGLPRGGYPTSYGDIGPRLGFAYDPWGRGKTAIRGGFGIFYDRIRTDYLGNTAANPPFIQSANVFDGNIDDPRGGTTRSFPPNLSAIRADMPTPKVISMNLGVQQELPGAVILHVNYVGTLGRNLTRTVNINQLAVGTRLNPPASTTNVNALRPYLGYGNISVMENEDRSNYNALQVSAVRKMRKGLEFGINYAFSRTLDTSSGTPQYVYNVAADYGLSSIHRAHVLSVNYVYEIPFFRQHRNTALRGVLGGWSLSGVTVYQSGAPFSVTVPVDVARIGVTTSRATLVGDPNLPASERTPARWFDTEAFLPAERMTAGQFGNSGRNILIGPSFRQWDVGLSKWLDFSSPVKLQLRAEAFNVFSQVSFTNLNTTVRFDSAGRPTQGYGGVTAAGPGRTLEFGARVVF